jgi:hypothetical protein
MAKIIELTETQLGLLLQDKDHFNKLKVGGLVSRNIGKTEAASKELSDIMVGKSPASIKSAAEAMETRRALAFSKAVAAFEGATGGENEADKEDDSD